MYCTRCGMTFTRDSGLLAHSRMAQACEVQAFPVPDGLTKDQERLLKKKRKQAGSQVDRWKEMYKILFPDDDENDIPEPCKHSMLDFSQCLLSS